MDVARILSDNHRMSGRIALQPCDNASLDLLRRVATGCVMATVVDDRHPSLLGRILVQWDMAGDVSELWVATLQGLPVRTMDRVLLMRPVNGEEWIAVGVVDGFAQRPEVENQTCARLELRRDESVRIANSEGRDLMELHQGESGPVLKVLHEDVEINAPGRLRLRGKQVELHTEGRVEIKASDDVVIRGEVIRLN